MDVLTLQEMDAPGTERIARALGFNSVYYPSGIHPAYPKDFGCAVLSPWPLEAPSKLVFPHGARVSGLRRAAASATVVRGTERVRVYSLHLPAPLSVSPGARREQLRALAADAARYEGLVVIAGDFNSHGAVEELARAGFRWTTRDTGDTTRVRLLGMACRASPTTTCSRAGSTRTRPGVVAGQPRGERPPAGLGAARAASALSGRRRGLRGGSAAPSTHVLDQNHVSHRACRGRSADGCRGHVEAHDPLGLEAREPRAGVLPSSGHRPDVTNPFSSCRAHRDRLAVRSPLAVVRRVPEPISSRRERHLELSRLRLPAVRHDRGPFVRVSVPQGVCGRELWLPSGDKDRLTGEASVLSRRQNAYKRRSDSPGLGRPSVRRTQRRPCCGAMDRKTSVEPSVAASRDSRPLGPSVSAVVSPRDHVGPSHV